MIFGVSWEPRGSLPINYSSACNIFFSSSLFVSINNRIFDFFTNNIRNCSLKILFLYLFNRRGKGSWSTLIFWINSMVQFFTITITGLSFSITFYYIYWRISVQKWICSFSPRNCHRNLLLSSFKRSRDLERMLEALDWYDVREIDHLKEPWPANLRSILRTYLSLVLSLSHTFIKKLRSRVD